MRRIALFLSLTGLAAATSLAAMSAPARADTSVPAPFCDSFGSVVDCFIGSPPIPAGVTPTWTIWTFHANPQQWSVTSGGLWQGCTPGWDYSVYYSYTSGGVTYTSDSNDVVCTQFYP